MSRKPKVSSTDPGVPKVAHKRTVRTRRTAAQLETAPAAASGAALFDPKQHAREIEEAAYFLWLKRGNAPGSAEEDWLRAEAQIRAKYATA
jgi:hypothetical protein